MLLRRVLTAAVLLAAFLAALLLLERPWFAVLVGLVMAMAGYEWGRLAGFARLASLFGLANAAAYAALAWTWHPLAPADPRLSALFAVSALFWLVLAPAWLRSGPLRPGKPLLAATGIFVLVPTGLAALALSPQRLLLALGLVWLADTAAYFAGRAFGRHKLAPAISPGKTWEGVGGAAAATLIYAIICALPGAPLGAYVRGAGWVPYLAVALLLCAVSIAGDLFESALKRQAGAKDSGAVFPGHGGVLDRIDSLTSTLPIAALAFTWIAAT